MVIGYRWSSKSILRIYAWVKDMNYGYFWEENSPKRDAKDLDSTSFWQKCVKREVLVASIVIRHPIGLKNASLYKNKKSELMLMIRATASV